MDPLPSESDLLANFSSGYFEGAEVPGGYDDYRRRTAPSAQQRGGGWRAWRSTVAVLPPGVMLDIGCAYGYALDEARAQGWSVVGVEPSPPAAQRAEALGIDVPRC